MQHGPSIPRFSRRRFVKTMIGAGLAAPALELIFGRTPFPGDCAVRVMRIAGPSGWAGKRIVYATDVHYGNDFGPAEAAALNTIVARERPDAVIFGGDLAHHPNVDLGEFFARWSPGCPCLFAPGNHDLVAGRMTSPVTEEAARAGVTVLCNAVETWSGLAFIGLPSALRDTQDLSLLKRPGLKIVLSHEPDTWDWTSDRDLVQLAGHTHGGQVRFFGGAVVLPELGKKYSLGRYSQPGGRSLLVSAGVGYTGIPVRINCPPEICRIEFS